jgi:hypothetical protein
MKYTSLEQRFVAGMREIEGLTTYTGNTSEKKGQQSPRAPHSKKPEGPLFKYIFDGEPTHLDSQSLHDMRNVVDPREDTIVIGSVQDKRRMNNHTTPNPKKGKRK